MSTPEEASLPTRGGKGAAILGALLPAVLAAAAAFAGAKIAAGAKTHVVPEAHAEPAKPPGPTMVLEPFIVTSGDATKKHAMKVTLAVEFDATMKEDAMKLLVPRVRDATLAYLRSIPVEEATDQNRTDRTRAELLEKLKLAGASQAQRILVTDMVIQ
ncbi:MAG: flagellar basal body-associated FliL family protein [Polyangiaceae bacterium]